MPSARTLLGWLDEQQSRPRARDAGPETKERGEDGDSDPVTKERGEDNVLPSSSVRLNLAGSISSRANVTALNSIPKTEKRGDEDVQLRLDGPPRRDPPETFVRGEDPPETRQRQDDR